jgi:hypothetical protein
MTTVVAGVIAQARAAQSQEVAYLLTLAKKWVRSGIATNDEPWRPFMIRKFLPLFIWLAHVIIDAKITTANGGRSWNALLNKNEREGVAFWQYLTSNSQRFCYLDVWYNLPQLNTFLQCQARRERYVSSMITLQTTLDRASQEVHIENTNEDETEI